MQITAEPLKFRRQPHDESEIQVLGRVLVANLLLSDRLRSCESENATPCTMQHADTIPTMVDQLSDLSLELEAAALAHPYDPERNVAALERAVQAYKTDPIAKEWFDLGDLYLDLATEYQQLERYDDALAAADAAVAAGLQMRPDARCLRAEILMRAGRVAEAEPIWAAVHAATPDDVWLYNNAGLEYADAGEPETALRWLTQGLKLALRTGDPERIVDQLTDLRQANLDKIGQPADELQTEAAAFLSAKTPTASAPTSTNGPVEVAWVTAEDYHDALELWPAFAESELLSALDGPISHARYCWALQQRLVAYSEAGLRTLAITPIRIAQFNAWCAEHNRQPELPDTRGDYVVHLTTMGSPDQISWPPGRNEPCWCDSGRKYKKCCAAPEFVERTAQA